VKAVSGHSAHFFVEEVFILFSFFCARGGCSGTFVLGVVKVCFLGGVGKFGRFFFFFPRFVYTDLFVPFKFFWIYVFTSLF
jgi:hypothetical protein